MSAFLKWGLFLSDTHLFKRLEQDVIAYCQSLAADIQLDTSRVVIELPRDETHGDLATNAAMVLSKQLSMKPRDLAQQISEQLATHSLVEAVDIAGPGFINITLKQGVWGREVAGIISQGADFGRQAAQPDTPEVNVEFVSANPTGPLHAAHARGAILGDVLANLLAFAGHQVTREYYINDAGAQVDILARSAHLRYRQALGEKDITIAEGLYPGEYLIEVGEALAQKFGDSFLNCAEEEWLKDVRDFTIDAMMASIKADLVDLGIEMDVFTSERGLVVSGQVSEAINSLSEQGLVYRGVLEPPKGQLPEDWEPREQLLFKATEFGDDTDRPLQKSDESWTYFASDVAYHADKVKRTNGRLINIWGADHGGYVKRMKAATHAISGKKDVLDVKLCQLVSLLDAGKPVKMSKRAGTFVTLRDVMNAVGPDVMRFIMLTRRSDQTLEFDYAKVTEKSRDNPVFYVQYAHARCCSVLRQNQQGDIDTGATDRLVHQAEIRVIKHLASWPSLVKSAAETHEPHRICFYLIELAGRFHSLWNAGREDAQLRFIVDNDDALTAARLALVAAVAQTIHTGLSLLSVQAATDM